MKKCRFLHQAEAMIMEGEAISAQEAVQGQATQDKDMANRENLIVQAKEEARAIPAKEESKSRLAREELIQVPAKEEAVIIKNLGSQYAA